MVCIMIHIVYNIIMQDYSQNNICLWTAQLEVSIFIIQSYLSASSAHCIFTFYRHLVSLCSPILLTRLNKFLFLYSLKLMQLNDCKNNMSLSEVGRTIGQVVDVSTTQIYMWLTTCCCLELLYIVLFLTFLRGWIDYAAIS